MLSPLLVVDNSICSGFECPLTVGLCAYFVIAIIACCCCYPGACFCPQRFKDPTQPEKPASGLGQLNLLGSIGELLEQEEKLKQDANNTDEGGDGSGLIRRRKRGRPSYY
tara:strand:+ start:1802 stop:2131 length:330 start_codon:yes stop_codon:yes gene_type:complete